MDFACLVFSCHVNFTIYSDDDESDVETSEYPKPNSDILPVDLEPDISLILKLMPDKAYDEVRFMLEAHQNDPSRVQVI